jgi:flagellar protein FlgJ
MSSILDTSSLYSAYGQSVSNATSASLESTLSNVSDSSSDDELMSVCKSFESYFVQKIIEEAKTSIAGEDEDEEGEYMQYFGDIMNEQYANLIVESGSTGLAQQLYDSMKDNYSL